MPGSKTDVLLRSRKLRSGFTEATILLFACGGCRHAPPFAEDLRTEYFHDFPAPAARFAQSDLVVVGTIKTVDTLGPAQWSTAKSPIQHRFLIEPIRIRVLVENSFKRHLHSPIMDLYSYIYSQQNDRQLGHPLPFTPAAGQRRLLFIRSDGNRFRLLHDVFDYSLRVFSGRHDVVDPRFASTGGASISWMLLSRSSDSAPDGFAVRLGEYTWYAHELAGTPLMMELLRRLVVDPDD